MKPKNNDRFMEILKTLDNLSVLKFEEKKKLAEMIVDLHNKISEEIDDLNEEAAAGNENDWTSSNSNC